jgi:hypothetical protein
LNLISIEFNKASATNNDPIFRPMMVILQRKPMAGLDLNPFDTETFADLKHPPAAPWALTGLARRIAHDRFRIFRFATVDHDRSCLNKSMP